jgi:hypothetical protein
MLLSLTNLAREVENWYDIPIYSSLTLLLVFIISWILSYYREGASQISFNSILDSGFDVVSISILPIFGFILVYERLMLNTRLKTAKSLSQTISKIKQNDIVPDVSFLAENNKDVFRLKLNQLLFIEANDNYSSFSYLEKGQVKKELIRGSLKRMQEQIDNEALIRCHKSYIVNLNKINKVLGNAKGYRLQLDEVDIEIPVSRSFPKSIIEKIKSKH